MLKTKAILAPIEESDGMRISVMSRHTLNDGILPDRRIKESMWRHHFKDLAASPKLVGAYLRKEISWEEYEKRYLEEIRQDPKAIMVTFLACLAIGRDITIMCIEDTPEFCHRRLLAEECKRVRPQVEIFCR